MSPSDSLRPWSAVLAGAAITGSALLGGCALLPQGDAGARSDSAPAESRAAESSADTEAQRQFFDNAMLMIPMVASLDSNSSWAAIEPAAWDRADPTERETVVGMGEAACDRADEATATTDLEDPAMTWLAAQFLCPEHREIADEFLSSGTSVSPTHSMADLFELALVQDDATADDLIAANRSCVGALALAWEVHAGATPDTTCWLIRVQSVEETGGDSDYLSFFTDAGSLENAASDARFAELAQASGATPNDLTELLEGVE